MPLIDKQKINERLDLVEKIMLHNQWHEIVTERLKSLGDIERLVSKISSKKIGPREMLQLASGLKEVAYLKTLPSAFEDDYLHRLLNVLDPCMEIAERISKEISENAPNQVQKGGYINQGVNHELDHYRDLASGGKKYLLEMQQKEILETGISSLKVGFNNIFGYYLEVSNSQKNKVPSTWIRKQTLTNGERYITSELKEYEDKIMGAEDKISQLESSIYESLLNALQPYMLPMQQNAQVMAIIDCLCSFATKALQNNYCKPVIHDGDALTLKSSRHPVIETMLPPGDSYVANDLHLDQSNMQLIILTGPNMSGKSALLRQTAIIVLMAHMGSFVPAEKALIPLTDKIFTRVGASDNLSGGESTFMVEMNETASIINNISSKSLVILDEIGRGTSTYDGISIASSIAEYLHDAVERPKTLFATHYHEMNELEVRLSRVKNFHITHREVDNKILFLRKLAPGGSTHSFGIHVARMAGMPALLLNRANEILRELEKREGRGAVQSVKQDAAELQLTIFDQHSMVFDQIRQLLEGVDMNSLTPVEALVILNDIKKKLG
jgi:DNA mismatch repair protein MutS